MYDGLIAEFACLECHMVYLFSRPYTPKPTNALGEHHCEVVDCVRRGGAIVANIGVMIGGGGGADHDVT